MMRRAWLSGLVLVITLLVQGGCTPMSSSVGEDRPGAAVSSTATVAAPELDGLATEIDHYVTQLEAQQQFSGVLLAVFDGQTILERGYGWADRERGYPNLPTTRFQIGSLSKAFTALAILSLQAEGRLRVEDSICRYLDPCPAPWQAVTLHQLLTHTSGIVDYVTLPQFWVTMSQRAVSVQELIQLIATQPLLAPPGEQFHYSSSGYVLLGYIIGRVAYPDLPVELAERTFLTQTILRPLGMAATSSGICSDGAATDAIGYRVAWVQANFCHPASLFAMGDMTSTASDLARWGRALGDDRLITPELRATLTQRSVPTSDPRTSYGYGWYVSQLADQQVIWHAGATPGYRSFIQVDFAHERMVVLLANYEAVPIVALGEEIAAMMRRWANDHERSTLEHRRYPPSEGILQHPAGTAE